MQIQVIKQLASQSSVYRGGCRVGSPQHGRLIPACRGNQLASHHREHCPAPILCSLHWGTVLAILNWQLDSCHNVEWWIARYSHSAWLLSLLSHGARVYKLTQWTHMCTHTFMLNNITWMGVCTHTILHFEEIPVWLITSNLTLNHSYTYVASWCVHWQLIITQAKGRGSRAIDNMAIWNSQQVDLDSHSPLAQLNLHIHGKVYICVYIHVNSLVIVPYVHILYWSVILYVP